MAIITISRGSLSGGRKTAECLAATLGYPCLGREILQEAAGKLGVPAEDLTGKLEAPPSLFARLTQERATVIPVGIRYIVGAFERPDALISVGSPLVTQTDIEAGCADQQLAVAEEVGRIDHQLSNPFANGGFEPIFIRTPSFLERLAERWLARLTRYRFPS